MRSYNAARRSFSFIEFIAKAAILVGGILAFVGGNAVSTSGPMAMLAAAVPGIVVAMIGSFFLVNIQTARATVDSAEYAQQSLKLSRDQLDLSKQMLALAKAPDAVPGYATEASADGLQNVSFDTDAETTAIAQTPHTPVIKTHEYAGKTIEQRDDQFFIEDKTFDSLREAHLWVSQPRPKREMVKLKAS